MTDTLTDRRRQGIDKVIQLIADWISSVGEPVDKKQICKHFDITTNEWRAIREQIRDYPNETLVKTYGKKRGKKYYVEGIEYVTDEELAEQMYQVLYNSEHELLWTEMIEGVDLFQKYNLSPRTIRSRSPNIQRILKESYPDFIVGSKRRYWAIRGHHDVRRIKHSIKTIEDVTQGLSPNYCSNCGMKLKGKPNYCSNCGCKI